jgi:hypothetical protein
MAKFDTSFNFGANKKPKAKAKAKNAGTKKSAGNRWSNWKAYTGGK